MASGENQEDKKSLGSGFGLFIILALLAVMWMQSFFEPQKAKVAFSYQVEHLVNLELIRPEECKKVATASHLVHFYGRFADQLSDSARQRFHYLELIEQMHAAQAQYTQLLEQQKAQSTNVLAALDLYAHLKGLRPEELSLLALPDGSRDDSPQLALQELSPSRVPTVGDLKSTLSNIHSSEELLEYRDQLLEWLKRLNSSRLGIAQEQMKQQARALLAQVQATDALTQVREIAQQVLSQASLLLEQLSVPTHSWRFMSLRSVRDYRDTVLRLQTAREQLERLKSQLERQRSFMSSTVWFFENHQLSSRALEAQESDQYSRWFAHAKLEWDRFASNQSLAFEASDQPNYLVLERTFESQQAPVNYVGMLFTLIPILSVGLLLYLMFGRQVKGAGPGAMSFGKSPAKLLQKGTHKVTFKDVAGIDEAKEELQEIVDFLKDPSKFTQLGAEIPKGVLCVGPPGTGKTLIAKAVAGEADRPFFSISGSDFVEMFVGVGASRIRDMFKEAKKQAPCIIFMDEIDAVGRHRGVGVGGGHDEREQTLNQLLVEMDGFEANEGIILMAATNRPDVLDKALLRPGRFDRRVTIDLPDIKGRYEILKLHARKIKMSDQVDLLKTARATPGGSGADLKNILNEAALHAVRQGHDLVGAEDIEYATDKVRFGKERRSLEMSAEEVKRTAYHEAGHAVIGFVSKQCDPVEKVTVIPRGMALGATYTLPKGNRLGYWRRELEEILAMIMGGRAAEEAFIGDISSGAQSDIQRATQLARSMICEWGMSSKVGQIAYDERSEAGLYLSGSQSSSKPYSEQTAVTIDSEVRTIIQQAHGRAVELMEKYREQVELMAQMLIEFETLDAQDVEAIMELKFDRLEKEKRVRQEVRSPAQES